MSRLSPWDTPQASSHLLRMDAAGWKYSLTTNAAFLYLSGLNLISVNYL